jgi:hypothetical protein
MLKYFLGNRKNAVNPLSLATSLPLNNGMEDKTIPYEIYPLYKDNLVNLNQIVKHISRDTRHKYILFPKDFLSSSPYIQLFEKLLAEDSTIPTNLYLNLPWGTPGGWVGLSNKAEDLEYELIRKIGSARITRVVSD